MSGSPIFCALDTSDADTALRLAHIVMPHVGGLKLGLEFFIANGPEGVRQITALGMPVFLDLKLHDIPNTVAGAVRAAVGLNVAFLTIHASGGRQMLRQAVEAAAGRVKLLGVSVLTSLDESDLEEIGQSVPAAYQVLRLAELARQSGLDGLVCSPAEIALVRRHAGSDFILMVPGIRPAASETQDQKRIMTPRNAIKAGADYLVIGRPITAADDPAAAAGAITRSLMQTA